MPSPRMRPHSKLIAMSAAACLLAGVGGAARWLARRVEVSPRVEYRRSARGWTLELGFGVGPAYAAPFELPEAKPIRDDVQFLEIEAPRGGEAVAGSGRSPVPRSDDPLP